MIGWALGFEQQHMAMHCQEATQFSTSICLGICCDAISSTSQNRMQHFLLSQEIHKQNSFASQTRHTWSFKLKLLKFLIFGRYGVPPLNVYHHWQCNLISIISSLTMWENVEHCLVVCFCRHWRAFLQPRVSITGSLKIICYNLTCRPVLKIWRNCQETKL